MAIARPQLPSISPPNKLIRRRYVLVANRSDMSPIFVLDIPTTESAAPYLRLQWVHTVQEVDGSLRAPSNILLPRHC